MIKRERVFFRPISVKADNHWAVSYGDLMSFLVIFFIMLYTIATQSMHTSDHEILKAIRQGLKGNPELMTEAEEKKLGLIKELESKVYKGKMGLNDHVSIDDMGNSIRLKLAQPVMFDTGKAKLKDVVRPVIKDIAAVLEDGRYQVIIEGHTDNIPLRKGAKYKSNWQLSYERAYSIINYMMQNSNIDPKRIIAVGYGEHRPVSTNRTIEGRSLNRRIEVKILLADSHSLISEAELFKNQKFF